jgi:hypothetical protein
MLLVHPKKGEKGKWEIAWMWLPHFLALDTALHKHVDEEMTARFKGADLSDIHVGMQMNQAVIEIIQNRCQHIKHLDGYLAAIAGVTVE